MTSEKVKIKDMTKEELRAYHREYYRKNNQRVVRRDAYRKLTLPNKIKYLEDLGYTVIPPQSPQSGSS